jgi:hypothetical protein
MAELRRGELPFARSGPRRQQSTKRLLIPTSSSFLFFFFNILHKKLCLLAAAAAAAAAAATSSRFFCRLKMSFIGHFTDANGHDRCGKFTSVSDRFVSLC